MITAATGDNFSNMMITKDLNPDKKSAEIDFNK
jgi:hypothetical protein